MGTPFGVQPRVAKGVPAPSVVPRERVYGKLPMAPKPSAMEMLTAQRERERKEALAEAWAACFRAAEALHATGVSYFDGEPAIVARITMKEIIKEVADKHGYRVTEITSARRERGLCVARHEAMWRCKMETQNSLPQIARAIGNRDHTTVLHGIRRHEERLAKEGRAG